jgi:predicted PurR-regulated permease PerM
VKERFQSKYAQIAVYTLLVIIVGALLVMLFIATRDFFVEKQYSMFLSILNPFIIGFALSYLLNPLMMFFETRVFRRFLTNRKSVQKEFKLRRMLSLLATFLTAAVFITLISLMIIPQVTESVNQLFGNVVNLMAPAEGEVALAETPPAAGQGTDYLGQFDESVYNEIASDDREQVYNFIMTRQLGTVISDAALSIQSFISGFGIEVDIEPTIRELFSTFAAEVTVWFVDYSQTFISATTDFIVSTTRQIMNILIAIVVAFYILSDKEHLISQVNLILFAILPERFANKTVEITRLTNKIFGGFIQGKLLDSLIIGLICFVFMASFGFEYAVLISVIVGITNVIPFFGPFIGAIPSIIFLVIVNPMQALWFTVFIIVLQQIDGNIIGPKIIGDTIGLTSFWVIFSILVMNGLLGMVGMFLGVPLCTVIYTLIKDFSNARLSKKGIQIRASDPAYMIRTEPGPPPPSPPKDALEVTETAVEAADTRKIPAMLDKLARSIHKVINKEE